MGHLQSHGLTSHLLEWLEVSRCRPNLQLGVAAAMELNDDSLAAIVDFEP